MPHVLIADDDTNFVDTQREILVQAGFNVSAAPNGEALLQMYDEFIKDGEEPDAILLDVLMPKVGGFDAAQMLLNRHYEGPILFCSGVIKTAQHEADARSKYGAKGYLSKPFNNNVLVDLLNELVGSIDLEVKPEAPQIPMPPEGGLLENPVIYLLMRIQREKHTGVLDLFGSGTSGRFRLFFFNGRATLGQSPFSYCNIGVELIRSGNITGEMYVEAKELAMSRSTGLYDVIKGEKWIDEATFKAAYRSILPQVVGQCIALSGQFRWTATSDFSRVIPAAPIAVLDLIRAGLQQATAKQLAPHLEPRKTLRLAPGEKWNEIIPLLQESCGSGSLERAINGRATIAQLQSAGKDEKERAQRMRQIYLLLSTQAVRASEQVMKVEAVSEPEPPPVMNPGNFVAPSSMQIPTEAAHVASAGAQAVVQNFASAPLTQISSDAPEESDGGIDFTPEELAAKAKIDAKTIEFVGKNFWEILNSNRGDAPNAIKAAYFQLARDFHADAFSGMRLGSSQSKLDTLFKQITDAYATLNDDQRRSDYELKFDMEAQGMSTDVGAVLMADQEFHKAKLLLVRGQANAAATILAKCVAVNPANLEWKSYEAYARWWGQKSPNAAVPLIKELDDAFKEMPVLADLAFFSAKIAFEIGNHKKALTMAKKAVAANKEHHDAVRLLRQVSSAQTRELQKGKTGGLMGLLKR
ncbi:MAG: response regulator [Deltaproteobacteria bacterium]|nr:response regulator [Deltaproteobacteria bacterium]